MLWAQVNGLLDKVRNNDVLVIVVIVAVIVLLVVVKLARGKKRAPDLEQGQREDLSEYPPAPAVGGQRLKVNGMPGRIRLVVVAPTGKQQDAITPDDVPGLLDRVLRGLGDLVKADKPRVRVWPPQLSVTGFGPTFHRLVESPDAEGKPSRWVKLAGPARTGKRPILLGLAVFGDEPSTLGDVQVETTEWGELLQIEK
ncbi:MAG TPA: hypothetical protein VHR66_22980 [Gemmataceae bacterium]|jgi:hypothetical protein|nr:hypothetical protein [Gemmataceae bacterium]